MSPQIAIVLVAVFVSIALAIGAHCFTGARVEHAGKPRNPQAGTAGRQPGAGQHGAHRGCGTLGETFSKGRAEVSKRDVEAPATSHGRRPPEPDGGGAVWRRGSRSCRSCLPGASRWCRSVSRNGTSHCLPRPPATWLPGLWLSRQDRAPAETGSQRLAGRPGPDDRVYRGWIGHRSSAGQDQ